MELTRRQLLAPAVASLASAQTRAKPPNIVFVLPDQLRYDDLGFLGGKNVGTPNIDRFASQGMSFTNALSTCPLCTPYRGMLLSGRYPTHTGMLINWLESNPREDSLALTFSAAGYETAYIGKWHLNAGKMKRDGLIMTEEIRQLEAAGDYSRRPRAEQEYVRRNPEPEFVPPGPARKGFRHWAAYNFHTEFARSYYYRDTPERLFLPRYETDSQIDQAIDYMRRAEQSGKPFFLVVSPHPPHQPWVESYAPRGYVDRVYPRLVRSPNVPPDAPKERGDLRYYYAMLANFDDAFGRLLAYLDSSPHASNTLTVLTTDHGEMLGSHGKWEKMSPFEEAVRIPLVCRWPGHVPAGRRTDALLTPMDHFPTLAALAGMRPPSGLDGIDLSPALLGQSVSGRDAALMANYSSHWDYFHTEWPWPEWRAVRTRQHTYVKWFSGKEELYDNAADPYQLSDLFARDTATLARLRSRLRELLAEAHDDFRVGHAYASWYDDNRHIVRTGLGPVAG